MRALSAYVNLVAALDPGSPSGGITMAKNKHRKHGGQQQDRSSAAEQSAEEARRSSLESQTEQRGSQVTPGDVARKGRQKRFGHN
ncbi:hypothetical protein [Streptomyces uncialis]|uniref:hypothetical protein n=1 Tax=Streptomyces uncialis TaxID=1048205 RepID=UPI000A4B67B6|nr:hypothetical protein [Streptomyces uncialis]MCX4663225.1 hypothetical protein [Streptomyces uncialis]WST70977.1 hypothetical protein OG268_28170 [Streptomyces uncialis]WTE10359.1 hypothetical protein OG924_08665 [Streptomyces uncialis]